MNNYVITRRDPTTGSVAEDRVTADRFYTGENWVRFITGDETVAVYGAYHVISIVKDGGAE